MNNREQINSEEIRMQGLVDRYLKFRSSTPISGAHLDEDSLNAFVEGTLNKRESAPILKHLIDCSFCLNVTAELAKLELAFAEEEIPVSVFTTDAEPTKVSDVLKGLLSRIFGTSGGEVFAHEEKPEDEIKEDKKES
jgi:hypothetical protein